MLTPQQIQETSFEKALFGGYDMDSVDDFLEPLTEDYITLYKENSVLKSKMRILVEKLEEYRKHEASMQTALLAAQKTCDQMVAEAEKKCAKMLHDAEETAAAKAQNVDALVGGEKERLEAAQKATAQFLDGMEKRLRRQLELMEELRKQELPDCTPESAQETPKAYGRPAPVKEEPKHAYDYDKEPIAPSTQEKADALIEEIGLRIEESLGGNITEKPSDPKTDTLTHGELSPAKQKIFEDLKFGRSSDPKGK